MGLLSLKCIVFKIRPEGTAIYRDDYHQGGYDWSNGKFARCQGVAQVHPGQHVMQADQYLSLSCELQSAVWGRKCVSRSVCLTSPLWSFFLASLFCLICPSLSLSHCYFLSSCHPSSLSLSLLLHCQALSDFCSDPNAFVLNSTNFNTGTSSGTVLICPCANNNTDVFHALYLPPIVIMSADLTIMTVKFFHIFSFVHWSLVHWCFVDYSDVLDYYLTCSRRMNSPFQQVMWPLWNTCLM